MLCAFMLAGATVPSFGQRGRVVKPTIGTTVLDPNQDGFVSLTNSGFSNDGYNIDEFEIPMFGIPIFEDGEVLNDLQAGAACGTTELTVDAKGFTAYAVLTTGGDLIFRFRVANDRPSVEAYTILIDTDGKIAADDPNSNPENPGFELDITLIKNRSMGVFVYNIDGIDSCPQPDLFYSYDTHFQIAVADIVSCGDPDFFYDYYVPFSDISNQYGITNFTELRMVALTNVSATCALAGKISDIGGVDDTQFAGCNSCAFVELAVNQCPTALSNLCPTCDGFLSGVTPKPGLNVPLKVGEFEVSGTSVAGQVFVDVFNASKTLIDQKTTTVNPDLTWQVVLDNLLQLGDSVSARAQGIGLCTSGSLSSGASFAIVIENIPPVISGSSDPLTYIENDPPVAIDNLLILSDVDDEELESATITMTNFVSGQDIVSAPPAPGLGSSFDAVTGIFTVTGSASLGVYQAFLRSITYHNTSEDPNSLPRTFQIVVSDGLANSNVFERQINVIPVNDPPTVSGRSTPVSFAGGTITLDNTLAVEDLDNLQLTGATISISANYLIGEDALLFVDQNGITGNFDGGTGVLTLTGMASLADYTSALASIQFANNNVSLSPLTRIISVQANDGLDNSTVFNLFIDFPGANNPPVIVDGDGNAVDDLFFTIDEDTQLLACLNVIDPDGDLVLITTITESTGNGEFLKTDNLCFSFTPALNFNGVETAKIMVCDQDGSCDEVNIHITVNPVNDPPEIIINVVEVEGNKTTEICVSFTDVEGDLAEVSSASPALGIVGEIAPGTVCFDFTPLPGFGGIDEIDITICDINDNTVCSSAVLPIMVIPPVNNPPVTLINGVPGGLLTATTMEDTPLVICFEGVDPDGDDVVLSDITNIEGGGSLSLFDQIEFCFEFVPEKDFNGLVTWEVAVCDDRTPSLCGTVVIAITVQPVNDPPVAVADSIQVLRNVVSFGNVLDNDFDIDGDVIQVEVPPLVMPLHGVVLMDRDGSFSYQSDRTFRGIDFLTYQVCDSGVPTGCDQGVLMITVGDVPLKPYQGVTPNGDGNNDFWRIDGIDFYTENKVSVFDRFNNMVFEVEGYNNENIVWKGEANKGKSGGLPEGTYFYHINLGDGSAAINGYVVLKRN